MRVFSTEREWSELLEQSCIDPVVILKHSNTCSISARGYKEVQKFEKETNVTVHVLVVQDAPELKIRIANETGVIHKSPQVVILLNKKAIYTASHYAISVNVLTDEFRKTLRVAKNLN